MGGGFLDRFLGTNGTTNGESPLEQIRARIQERVTAARTRMDEVRARFTGDTTQTQRGRLLAQFPRVSKFKRTGGLIGNLGIGKRLPMRPQTHRPPGMTHQNISPTSQEPALADDVYADRLRAESSPGLSVSL